MTTSPEAAESRRLGRFVGLDARPVNLDGFAQRDDEAGLVAFASANDPEPSVALDADGRIIELDGTAGTEQFDLIDAFIAARGLDPAVAAEANALDDVAFARLIVDPGVRRAPRSSALPPARRPEKLARVVALLRPVELQMAVAKMRVRRTPSNQAHVTNRLDDPLLLAADAATAVAYGFREVETTVPVNADAPSNALAVLIGSQVGAAGALTQCSVEEALELDLGLRGLTTYAETVSLYGTEKVFIDGDDTPWSKAFLCSAYASRGLKMRVTSGGGAEALMGAAEGRSMFSLESRCVALARAMGAQGVQNGGIDGASVVGSVPDGMRELLAENLLVMLRDLESCSGNDALVSESDMRRTAHTVPLFLAGSDFLFSGFGSIPRYDNMFGPSNFNAEDLDDYLVLQRDWGVDGALRPVTEERLRAVRERAARACLAVVPRARAGAGRRQARPGIAPSGFTDDHVDEVVHAEGSKDVTPPDPQAILAASDAIMERRTRHPRRRAGALGDRLRGGGRARARHGPRPGHRRLPADGGDLRRADELPLQGHRPQRLSGPGDRLRGPGGAPRADRRHPPAALARATCWRATPPALRPRASGWSLAGEARPGADPREVCVGVSPALATKLWFTMSGLPVGEALAQIVAGIESEGCVGAHRARAVHRRPRCDRPHGRGARGVRRRRRPAGQGHGAHPPQGLAPLACLELLSIAPLLTAEMYRELGRERRPPRQGPAAGAGAQPVHRPGDRGALPRRGRGAGRHRARRERARRAARGPGGASDDRRRDRRRRRGRRAAGGRLHALSAAGRSKSSRWRPRCAATSPPPT